MMLRPDGGAVSSAGGCRGSILIVTGNHLCRNPRVIKEAAALQRVGFSIEVLGAWSQPHLKAEDLEILARERYRFTPVVDSEDRGKLASLERLAGKVVSKAAHAAHRLCGVQSRWQVSSVLGALRRTALGRRFDLAIAHSEPALSVASDLQRAGRQVGVDMEDWFSEDLLPEARSSRPIRLLRKLEQQLLRRSAYTSCPSHAMSRALAESYKCPVPNVVYNAFPWADRASLDGLCKDRAERTRPSIHWYSQTLGAGRGLEDLLASLPLVRGKAEIHLRGQPASGFEAWLHERIPEVWRERVHVHGLVPNVELLSRIAEHDIGFAGEMKYCRSRDLTVTNKILHYLLAGLGVVASDTEGQREIAANIPGGVLLYPSGDPGALAQRIDFLLESGERLRAARSASLAAAAEIYCWERQETKLVQAMDVVFSRHR